MGPSANGGKLECVQSVAELGPVDEDTGRARTSEHFGLQACASCVMALLHGAIFV